MTGLCVLIAHGLVLYGLLQDRLVAVRPAEVATVALVGAPRGDVLAAPPKPKTLPPVRLRLVFDPPPLPELPDVTDPSEAAPSSPAPSASAPVIAMKAAPNPLTDELAVFCPERRPPVYPAQSKRLREQGEVTLRVELDERGQVSSAGVVKSSGSIRLDDAARAAVLTWRCNAAMREGKPTRAVAIQSLEFVLDGR